MSREQTYSVLIIDMFHYDDESELRIDGFRTPEAAKEFARRRVRDSVEDLRAARQTPKELRRMWLMFGEDALVLGQQFAGSHELDYFVAHPATAEERDWQALYPEPDTKG